MSVRLWCIPGRCMAICVPFGIGIWTGSPDVVRVCITVSSAAYFGMMATCAEYEQRFKTILPRIRAWNSLEETFGESHRILCAYISV